MSDTTTTNGKSLHEKLVAIQSGLKAPKGQTNLFGKYKYRSCEDILEAVKPLLKEHGCTLTLTDEVVMIGTRFYVKSHAVFTDGSKEGDSYGVYRSTALAREEETRKGMDSSQITGAASSYARKYALNGLFCIDDTKDADTMDNTKEVPKKVTPTKPTVTKIMETITPCKTEQQVGVVWNQAMKYSWTPQEMKDLEECKASVLARLSGSSQ